MKQITKKYTTMQIEQNTWEELAIDDLCSMLLELAKGEFQRPSQLRGRLQTLDRTLGSAYSDMSREEREQFIKSISNKHLIEIHREKDVAG